VSRQRVRRAVLITVAAASLTPAGSPAGAQLRPGVRAPEVSLKTLAGERMQLSKLRGHPVVITFWATWCPSCRTEFPELVALYRRSHKDGLEVLAVNLLDQELSEGDVRRFVTEFAVPFPVALDPRGSSRRAYQLIALPATVFIDSAGVIQRFHSGPMRADELRSNVAVIQAAP
jgi:peroxiredoxin